MRSVNILIVDSDPLNRRQIRDQITLAGFNVVGESECVTRASALGRRIAPDVILLASTLPELQKIESARAIALGGIAPVVIQENSAKEEPAYSYHVPGVQGLISSEYTAERIKFVISNALSHFWEVERLKGEIQTLKTTLESRRIIGKARATLMDIYGLSEQEAARRIHHQSVTLGKPAHIVARAILTACEVSKS